MHQIKDRQPLGERLAYRFDHIDPKRTAHLVIDMQTGFLRSGYMPLPGGLDLVDNINRVSRAVRRAGGVVIYTRHTITDQGPAAIPAWQRQAASVAAMAEIFTPELPGHAVDAAMEVDPVDLCIDKYRYSALARNSSVLADLLAEKAIETLIITGLATNACCESTARDAFFMGFKTFFLEDATAALTDEEHNAALATLAIAFADVRSTEAMVASLG
jgi:ureidoacrylate peracid hydrolase